MQLDKVKVGDTVPRMCAGQVMMNLTVSEVTEDRIICGPWVFSKRNGAEIDEDLDWDETHTGSYLPCDGVQIQQEE